MNNSAVVTRSTVLSGMGNQLRRESSKWWATGRWWRLALVWTGLIGGLLAAMLWILPRIFTGPGEGDLPQDVPTIASQFAEMAALVMAVGTIIASQSLLLEDRRSGVMEWILSKPLSRPALILSTFLGQLSGLLVAVVVLPGVAAWVLLSAADTRPWPLRHWLGAVAVLALLVAFQVALVLALNTLTWSRGVALGVPLLLLVVSDPVSAALPQIIAFNPYMTGRIAAGLLATGQVAVAGPLFVAAALTVVLVTLAAWRFSRCEL